LFRNASIAISVYEGPNLVEAVVVRNVELITQHSESFHLVKNTVLVYVVLRPKHLNFHRSFRARL